jgi:glycine betaine/choline ABC-type transport system substrate-binding protein
LSFGGSDGFAQWHRINSQFEGALAVYGRCTSCDVVTHLQKQATIQVGGSIYTAQVVIWLMILERLQRGGTGATAVEAQLGARL